MISVGEKICENFSWTRKQQCYLAMGNVGGYGTSEMIEYGTNIVGSSLFYFIFCELLIYL